MAPSVESQLLWVNKDVKSYKQSKRIPAAQAALINAHSQQRARAARTLASQQALRDGSAVKAIVGWRQRCVSPTASTSSLADQLPEESGTYRNRNSESRGENWEYSERSDPNDSSGKLSPHLAYICGKDEALDPFQCTAVKLDSKMHDLIQFYLARLHPSSWKAKPRGAHGGPDRESVEAVTECIADKARFFSLVACTAAYRESFEEEDQKGRGAIYLGQALVAVREQVQRMDFVKNGSLPSIVNMAICAELLGDYAASLAHLRAAKFVVDQGGGLVSLLAPSRVSVFKLIMRADLGLAMKTLSYPVFTCPWTPATVPLPHDKLDGQLEQLACDALVGVAQVFLPNHLHEYVYQLIECTRMLHYVWSYPSESETAIRQLGRSITAILYHLLSLSFEDHRVNGKRLEATRLSLTIWTFLLSQSLFNDPRASSDHIPVFSEASLNAKWHLWPSSICPLLKNWNRVVQSLLYKSNTIDGCTSIHLIRIVQAIERETEVKLGSVMERLFELEVLNRTRAASGINTHQQYQAQRKLLSSAPQNPSSE